jgi:hypothetical protein
VTVEAAVTVTCSTCGSPFELSPRNIREHRRRGVPHVCHECRHPPNPEEVQRRVMAMKQWWLKRYSLAELQSWPPF